MKKILLGLGCGLLATAGHAQLFIGASDNVFIGNGTQFFMDSLILTPSADLNLTSNTIVRSTSPINALGGPGGSIAKVYNITDPFSMQGTVGIKYTTGQLQGNVENLLQIAFTDAGTNWTTTSTSTVDQVNDIVSVDFASPTTVRRITATQAGVALPLSVSDFRASLQPGFVALQWQVSDNKSFASFGIQSSADGRNWKHVDEVKATGNEWDEHYAYQDADLSFTTRYYRLEMTSAKGEKNYTATQIVRRNGQTGANLVIEQDASNVNFRFTGVIPEHLSVYDMNGRVLLSQGTATGNYSISTLVPGIYVASYRLNGVASTQRFVVR